MSGKFPLLIIKKFYLLGIVFPVGMVYLATLAPTVIHLDAGELTAVQATLGIAHPTGYPLFTLAGYVFSLLPLPGTVSFRLNLLAAFWCLAGLSVFGLTVSLILKNLHVFITPQKQAREKKQTRQKKKDSSAPETAIGPTTISESDPSLLILIPVFAGFILAFSKTFWKQSTSVEVYSLHILLIMVALYTLLKAYIAPEETSRKNWFIFASALAIGFTNHMTTLLILPATALLFFMKHGFKKESYRLIGKMLLVFFPILILFYSYLPLRASSNPAINWGNPLDFERILRHISGSQYQVWIFSSFDAAKKQLSYFFSNLSSEFNISGLFVIAGIIFSAIRYRKLFYLLFTLFVATVFYAVNYDINDIDAYFLLAYIALGLFGALGIYWVVQLLHDKKFQYGLGSILVLVFVGIQSYFVIDTVKQNDNYTFEDYTKAALSFSDKNSIIFTYQWDFLISPAYYFQFVEKYRTDVKIIDKELLRRSWYYNQMERHYPGIISPLKADISAFLEALKPFERNEQFDANLLESYYRKIMSELVRVNAEKYTFYIAPELFENEMQRGEFTLPEGYRLVPDLFFYKVVKGDDYVPANNPVYTIRFTDRNDYYTETVKKIITSMLVRRAMYEMEYDKVERAKVYIRKIKSDFPDYRLPTGLAEVIVQ